MKTEFRGQASPVEQYLGQRYLGRSWQKSSGWRKTGLLPDIAKRILIETCACSLEQELRAFAHRIRWFLKTLNNLRYSQALIAFLLSAIVITAPARSSTDIPMSEFSRDGQESRELSIEQEIEAFKRSSISAREAIATAEKHFSGAKVVDISFNVQGTTSFYKVKVYHQEQIWDARIDATTNAITIEAKTPLSSLDMEDRSRVKDLKKAGLDLSDAVAVAEKYGSGKAIGGGLDRSGGKLVFLVVVFSKDHLKEISVDPTDRRKRSSKKLPVAR